MATAEEILQSMAEVSESAPVCVIDPGTRTIIVPPEYQLFGVENDKRTERLHFQCPKIVGDNQDLSRNYQLFINYQNANGEPDAYHIEDMEVDGDNITFSWLLEENVTKYRGNIQFAFGAIIPGDEAEDPDKNRWNTTINTDCTCLVGLKCTQQVSESNPDALVQIWAAIDELKAGGGPGGTTNYENLSNKPQLNGVTLEGNKTLDQVGVLAKNQGSNNSGKFLSVGSDGNVVPADAPSGGTVDPEQIKQAVNGYLEENPVSGMTAEQEQQLKQNTSDVGDLKSAINQKGLPEGGTTGQVLSKDSDSDFDATWKDVQLGMSDKEREELNKNTQDIDNLSKKLIAEVETPVYEPVTIIDLTDKSQLIQGDFADNVPVQSDSGKKWFTDYLPLSKFIGYSEESWIFYNDKPVTTPLVRFYDSEKRYIRQQYRTITSKIDFSQGEEYIVVEGEFSGYYGEKYGVFGQRKVKNEKLLIQSKEFNTDIIEEKSIVVNILDGEIPDIERISVIPTETYRVRASGMSREFFYNANDIEVERLEVRNEEKETTMLGSTYVTFAGNVGSKITITGKFINTDIVCEELKLVNGNFTPDIFKHIRENIGGSTSGSGVYYNCLDYGVIPGSDDNTQAMQELIDMVNENGGGVIWVPVGIYKFYKDGSTSAMGGNAQNNVYLKSNVSILGESVIGSVFKLYGDTQTGCSMFGFFTSGEDVLEGCTFSNFTVDLSEETMAQYSHKGKAFYVSGIKNCIFRDLRLISTPSTSLGIDMLDNVVMDSIYVYEGGCQWTDGGNGGAGIGIGTGKWQNENYIIRNCVCDSCGHFGIFLEDQGIFSAAKDRNYPKGQIISNNVIRNGRNYALGVRGGKNVLVTGNNLYENKGGIYTDYGAINIVFSNNLIQGCTDAGFNYGNEMSVVNGADYPCENIVITGNTFVDNTTDIKKTHTPINSQEVNNIFLDASF